ATAVQPPPTPPSRHASNPPSSNPPSSAPPSNTPSRFRSVLIAAGGALGLVAIALAAIILSGSGSNANAVYHQKLTGALAPVLAANTTLSSSLQSLSGTDTTTAVKDHANSPGVITVFPHL
ncbi:MAG: hypothetical protein ACXVHL_35490, partial [Solirubrobacteraceae bacterium]